MTYKARRKVTTRMIELRSSGSQTVSDGDLVLFPNKITTGGDSVSISSGIITLSSARSYYLMSAVGATRPSTTSDFSLEWFNEATSTKLIRTAGAFEARYLPTTGTSNMRNGSTVGQLIIDNPAHTISLRVNQLGSGNSATIEDNCHLFIIEMEY